MVFICVWVRAVRWAGGGCDDGFEILVMNAGFDVSLIVDVVES